MIDLIAQTLIFLGVLAGLAYWSVQQTRKDKQKEVLVAYRQSKINPDLFEPTGEVIEIHSSENVAKTFPIWGKGRQPNPIDADPIH